MATSTITARNSVALVLNLASTSVWNEVSCSDREVPIANSKLRDVSDRDTLAASKQLTIWVAR